MDAILHHGSNPSTILNISNGFPLSQSGATWISSVSSPLALPKPWKAKRSDPSLLFRRGSCDPIPDITKRKLGRQRSEASANRDSQSEVPQSVKAGLTIGTCLSLWWQSCGTMMSADFLEAAMFCHSNFSGKRKTLAPKTCLEPRST